MTRKISTFIFIGLIFTVVVWMMDKSSVVTVDWRSYHDILSVPELMLLVLVFVVVVDLVNRICRKIFNMQVRDVCRNAIFNSEAKENETIDVLAGKISEKIVMDRKDFDKSLLLVLKAMTAITAGDMTEARFHIRTLRQFIGNDPIIDVLKMKIYKGEKNFDKMEKLSEKIMKNSDIQIVGMKAAVEAQMEKKEFKEALATANKAFELRQDLYWIIESAFELRAKAQDWEGAEQVLDAGKKKKIIPVEKYKRLRAIILFERAKEFKDKGDDTNYFKYLSQAVDADETLAPAAIALAKYYKANDNQIRKASEILVRAWKKNPTDEIAYTYIEVQGKTTPKAKVQAMENLAMMNAIRPSLNNRLLAEISSKAGMWKKAKGELELFLINNPCTKKVCSLISEYEKYVNNDKEAAKVWDEKFEHCALDSKWVCETCGEQSDEWHSVCPSCKSFGQNKWHLYIEEPKVEPEIEDDDDEEED